MRFLTATRRRLSIALAVLCAAMVSGWTAGRAAAQQPAAFPEFQDAPQPYPEQDPQTQGGDRAAVRLGFKALDEVSMDLQDSPGRLPDNYAKQALAEAGEEYQGPGYMRSWAGFDFYWLASGVCHRPLYFEEIYLERHGYNFGCAQPLVSAAHFFGRIPTLPYMMVVDPPCDCVYPLGHYRPGSCAPFRYHVAPLRADAGLVEAGVVTGLVFLVP